MGIRDLTERYKKKSHATCMVAWDFIFYLISLYLTFSTFFLPHSSQNAVTRKGTLKSMQKPWKTESVTRSLPL